MEICANTMQVHKLAELGQLTATLIVVCRNFKIEVVNHDSIYKCRFEDIKNMSRKYSSQKPGPVFSMGFFCFVLFCLLLLLFYIFCLLRHSEKEIQYKLHCVQTSTCRM